MSYFDSETGFYWLLAAAASLGVFVMYSGKTHLQRILNQFCGVPSACGLTGSLATRRLLDSVGLAQVPAVRSTGVNCFHPLKREIQLRDDTFDGTTIASLAIAAHEVGHAQQFATGYWPARLRLWVRPVYYVLMAAMLAMVVLCFTYLTPAWLGFSVIGVGTLMLLVQVPAVLPLECDASRRAKLLVVREGLLAPYEESSFDRLLKACSRTYLARECQRWIILLAGGVAIFWMTPVLPADRGDELAYLEQLAAAKQPAPAQPAPPMVPAAPIGIPQEQSEPLVVDLTYPLLSSLGTLIPALLLIFVLTRFAKTPRQRPSHLETAVARNNAGSNLSQRGELAAAIEAFSAAIQGSNPIFPIRTSTSPGSRPPVRCPSSAMVRTRSPTPGKRSNWPRKTSLNFRPYWPPLTPKPAISRAPSHVSRAAWKPPGPNPSPRCANG
jgi:Zn-dependent membrane protease YugP